MRPVELIVQVMVFRVAIYIVRVLMSDVSFSFKTLIVTLLPANYFVILYCAVFLISPFINMMLDRLSEKAMRTFLLLSFLIFAVYPTFVDVLGEVRGAAVVGLSSIGMYGSQWGYTIVNFVLMYLIGAYLRKGYSRIQRWSSGKLIVGLILCVVAMMAWARVNDKIGFLTERSAWEYCNPLVIAEAAIIFCLFQKNDIGTNKVINKLAEGVFTVFLLHHIFLPYLKIERFVTGNPAIMVLHVIGSVVAIYIVCWVVHLLYHLIADPIFKALSAKVNLPIIDAES